MSKKFRELLITFFALGAFCILTACGGGNNEGDIITLPGDDPPAAADDLGTDPAADPFSVGEWYLGQTGNVAHDADGANASTVQLPDWAKGWTVASVGTAGKATAWEPAGSGTLGGEPPSADGRCPDGTTLAGSTPLPARFDGEIDVCDLAASYTSDGTVVTLTNDNVYRIGGAGTGGTIVGDEFDRPEVTLDIEPGTLLLGGRADSLVVTRGSHIVIDGAVADPVVMGSTAWFEAWISGGDGSASPGEWGGLAIAGTGTIQHLVIRNAGARTGRPCAAGAGLTLHATGKTTRISHIQIHDVEGDGLSVLGGSTDLDHILVTGAGDDGLDLRLGYRGRMDHVFIDQRQGWGDRGIEVSGGISEEDPETTPTVSNAVVLGAPSFPTRVTVGLLLGRGTSGAFEDIVASGFDACLDIDGTSTFHNASDGTLTVERSSVSCRENFIEE